jgi:acylphosphatase
MPQGQRFHIFVSGRVQGVFFRENTRRKAKSLEIKGWVRNLTDGRVEAVLEGEKEKLEELTNWLKEGPVFAKVDNLEIKPEENKNEFTDFEVRYE